MLKTNEIIDFFKLESSHAKKELGQNFLINEEVAKSIVDSLEIKKDDKVLEIGPGLGALSENLIGKSTKLTLVEYDKKFVNFLEKSFENKNVTIVKGNILKFKDFDFNKVIGNLPYYITSEIIEYLALNFDHLEKGVYMVQTECFKRFTALEGKNYNALNILLYYLFDTKELFRVNKTNFFPSPKVESLVFKIDKKEDTDFVFAKKLYRFAKISFSNRRKTLINNVSSLINNKEETIEILKELGFKETVRAEEISPKQFILLTLSLLNKKIFLEV